jgi:hypothetical protein
VKYCGAGDDKDFGHDWSLTEKPKLAGVGVGDIWVNPRGRRFEVLYFAGKQVILMMVWDGPAQPGSAIPELMCEANDWRRVSEGK